MKIRTLKHIFVFLIGALLLLACAKEEQAPVDPNGGGSAPTSFFTWTTDNGSTVNANDFYFVTTFNNIVGKKTSNGSFIDISLDNLSEGAYTISSSKGIILEYNDGTKSYFAASGVVNITKNTGTKLSGNFNAYLSGSTVLSVSGNFEDIPAK